MSSHYDDEATTRPFWTSPLLQIKLIHCTRFTLDRVCRVSSRLFSGAVSHCSATLRVCQIMYRPKQFCAWHATFETEFHPSQTGGDHGAVLLSPSCTRSVQTVVCPLETPSTAPRIGPCGERTLRPPRPRVDNDDYVRRIDLQSSSLSLS